LGPRHAPPSRHPHATATCNCTAAPLTQLEALCTQALGAIFARTALNVHPCAYDAYGMTLVEAAAFGCPSLVNGGGAVGATELLGADGCVQVGPACSKVALVAPQHGSPASDGSARCWASLALETSARVAQIALGGCGATNSTC
jgi:hypothetical protein